MELEVNSSWRIETLNHAHFEAVLPLISAYQRFYGIEPDEEKNRAYFRQFIDDQSHGILFVIFDHEGGAAGFATLYFVPSSLSAQTTCTFNDLYTVPAVRGSGMGVSLGLHALVYARNRGFKKVFWLTSPSNKTAQQIYEYTQAERTEWVMYTLPLFVD